MEFAYYCLKCRKTYLGWDESSPSLKRKCPKCGAPILADGRTVPEWKALSDEKKDAIYDELMEKPPEIRKSKFGVGLAVLSVVAPFVKAISSAAAVSSMGYGYSYGGVALLLDVASAAVGVTLGLIINASYASRQRKHYARALAAAGDDGLASDAPDTSET